MTAASKLRRVWDRISRLDLVALLLALAGGFAYLFDVSGKVFNFLQFILRDFWRGDPDFD